MRILCGTILALLAALSAQGAGDSLAESPEGVGNIPANGVLTNGALIISFDDRNLADWERAIPLFDKYDAHATFFFTGRCEGDAARVLKKRLCAERNEVFVLTSHGIHPDAKHIHMKTEWLERILATASECGVQCLGFDELK